MKKRTKTVARRPPRAVAGLEALRQEIDAVDQRIQAWIAARAGLAQQVAVVKGGKGSAADFYRPEREVAVLRGVVARNKGPLTDEEMVRLFR